MSERPLRDRFSDTVERIPRGPLGKVGEGNLIGGAGFLAVESSKPFFDFLPGVKQPGYKITAHSTERRASHTDHTITIAAVSEEVAEFAAQYESAPSNIDYLTAETEIIDKQIIEEERGYSIWKITVRLAKKGTLENTD